MFGPNPITDPERCECCGRSLAPGEWSDEIVGGGYMVVCRPCKMSMTRHQDWRGKLEEAA